MKQLINYIVRTSLVASSLILLTTGTSLANTSDNNVVPTTIQIQQPKPTHTSDNTSHLSKHDSNYKIITNTKVQTTKDNNKKDNSKLNTNSTEVVAYQQLPSIYPEPFPIPKGFTLQQIQLMQTLASSLKVTPQAVAPISTLDYHPVFSTSINPNLSGMITLDNQVDELMYLPLLSYPQNYQQYRANLAFLYDYFNKFNAYANQAKYAFAIGNFYDPQEQETSNNSSETKNLKLSSMMAEVSIADKQNSNNTTSELLNTINSNIDTTKQSLVIKNKTNNSATSISTSQSSNNKTTPDYNRPQITYVFVTQNNKVTHTKVLTSNLVTDTQNKLYLKPQAKVIIAVLDLNGITNQSPLEIIIQNNSKTEAVPLVNSLTNYVTALLDLAVSDYKSQDHTYTDIAKQEKITLNTQQQANYNLATKIVTPKDKFLQSLSYSPQALDNLLEDPNIGSNETQNQQENQITQQLNQQKVESNLKINNEHVQSHISTNPVTKQNISTNNHQTTHTNLTTTNTTKLSQVDIQGDKTDVSIVGGSITAGSIHINAGNININNSKITAKRDLNLTASNQVKVQQSQVTAPNTQATAPKIIDDGSLKAAKAQLHQLDSFNNNNANETTQAYSQITQNGQIYPLALEQSFQKPVITGFIYPRMLGVNKYFLDVLDHHDLIYKTRPVYPIDLVIAVMDQLPYASVVNITTHDANAFLAQKYHFVSKFPHDSYLAIFRYNYLQTK